MRFAHLADCHLGCWRTQEMKELTLETFRKAIDKCIEENVDFVLIAGDLFDSAIPSVEALKCAAEKLKELREKGIACYVIHGSHDYSASGKSMLSVLEKAGLCIDVSSKPFQTEEFEILGIGGKKGGLEQQEIRNVKLEKTKALSILLLHTAINLNDDQDELFPKLAINELPSGFDYYALGHLHEKSIVKRGNSIFAYPGALFPTNFSELEEQHASSFFIVEYEKKAEPKIKEVSFSVKPVINLTINADNETPRSLKEKILENFAKLKEKLNGAILTLRIVGTLKEGKPSEIDFVSIEREAKKLGVYSLIRNVAQLKTREFELEIESASLDLENLEEKAIEKITEKLSPEKKELVKLLIKELDIEKREEETNSSFASRLNSNLLNALRNHLMIEEEEKEKTVSYTHLTLPTKA